MFQDEILSNPGKVLSEADRAFYFEQGYVVKPQAIGQEWLDRLNAAMDALVETTRSMTQSSQTYDLDTGHTSESPRLRRIAYLDDLDSVFWEFCKDSPLADLAADLLGPNVRFRECLINFKWAGGGQEVKWHQDFPFYPLTNTTVAQFLVCLNDVGPDQGPLQVVPQSHKGPFYDHYDQDENWLGYIEDDKLTNAGLENAVDLTGPAGTVTVHHCATLHASRANLSKLGRPVLIVTYCACDAIGYTAVSYPSSNALKVVRGQEAKFARLEPMEMRMPPDWSDGYTSIFEHQEES
ncbi:Phytanoyl-CoA dioxygenase (PhyH) [Roseovarius albus]|uniref:Phytanoyl-CoA dioxygenase (PhyH) n=1 Tax=Roseovarius albus TaxID=1247867 RepID=A0A1X6ZQE8_9RHOB|nr:phytanoyl-CoA dioxygenase family protein [Roseovarius albus]SLN58138.1 Phytanoyl-CoA dioxygenase (PhyH) [Roseovarius albus]